MNKKWLRIGILSECLLFLCLGGFFLAKNYISHSLFYNKVITTNAEGKKYIKYVEFNVSYEAMKKAYQYDVDSYDSEHHYEWIPMLAYAACKSGGSFSSSSTINKSMQQFMDEINNGKSVEDITKDMKHYSYYYEAYEAVLGGMVGEYKIEVPATEGDTSDKVWKETYGLKAFLPLAKNFPYSDYDDFGAARSYGYSRPHLGHDMMGQTGTPVIAVESGFIECLGWNQYGGWRIGIRSFDKKRYYYYAHLRQNFPYCRTLSEGSLVTAGDVIGYLGHTGYSSNENVNNINQPHLHFGLQLIFDESQKEGNNEIWIDCYALTRFLYQNRSEAIKNLATKEWYRKYEMEDPSVTEYEKQQQEGTTEKTDSEKSKEDTQEENKNEEESQTENPTKADST